MILIDASALVALIDVSEPMHRRCVEVAASNPMPLVTTLPALTEAAFLLRRRRAESALWRLVQRRDLRVEFLDEDLLARCLDLIARYASVPMALADTTLVALAENRNDRRIFTIDADFQIYRSRSGLPLQVIP